MNFVSIGIDFHHCSLSEREKVSFTTKMKHKLQTRLHEIGLESVILTTCNRTEIFVGGLIKAEDLEVVKEIFGKRLEGNLGEKLQIRREKEGISHLIQLACGFQSMVFGEDQILHQLRLAYEFSLEHQYTGKILNEIVQSVFRVAKGIKSHYRISETPSSVSYMAICLLRERLQNFEGKKILLVGVGNMGKLTLKYLLESAAKTIYLTNRTHEKIHEEIPPHEKIEIIRYEERYQLLKEVDVIISTTASPHVIFKAREMKEDRPGLIFVDLAIPRDIDPAIGRLPGVELIDMDCIQTLIEENLERRREISQEVEEQIFQEVEELYHRLLMMEMDQDFEKNKELTDRIEKALLRELGEEHRKIVHSVLRRELEKPLSVRKEGLMKLVQL